MQHNTTAHLRRRLIPALALTALFTQPALPVFAQTATAPATPPTESTTSANPTTTDQDQIVKMEEFTVTSGFANSLAIAAAAKEAAPTITEVLVAEDIGKLPDISIADSLTRLPGLTTQRVNGRSQDISIRGLTGDFSTAMLNGREQVSTGENRSVEFDQYPADLLDSVVVYKTAQADLTGQGLAGTIDLRTVRPLSKGHRSMSLSGYYQWTQYHQLTPGASANGNRFTASYVDQFDNNTLGIAVGISHSSTPWEGKQFQAWGYPTDSSGNFALGGTKSYVRTSNLDRDGIMGVVEYRPNDWIHSSIDIFSSRFEEKQLLRGMEIPLAFWSSANLQPGYTVSGGLITKATLTNVQPVVRNDVFKRNDSPFALGWNLVLGERSEWPIVFDFGYSRVTRTDENLETYSGLGFRGNAANPDTMTVQLIPGQIPIIHSTLNYSDGSILKLSDPQGWGSSSLQGGGMEGYLKYFQAKDELGQFKASTDHKMKSVFNDLELGVSYSDRYKRDGENPSGFVTSKSSANTQPLPPQIGTTDMSFLGLGPIYAYDPLSAWNNGTWAFSTNNYYDYVARRFEVEEKTTQPYVQFDVDTKLGSVPMSGDIGVRAVNIDQSSKGYASNGNILNYVTGGDKYTDFAPEMNFKFGIADQTFLRLSVARQLARPRMYDMRASRNWSYDPTLAASTDLTRSPWSGDSGNPQLRPWRSNSFDLTLERYFGKSGAYFAINAFEKKLLTYIYTQSRLVDFSGYPVPSGSPPVLHQGVVTQPVNGTGGNMSGLEATVQLPIELITSANVLHGFGLKLDGAYTDSRIAPWGPGNGDAPIAGFSRKVANATIYYERAGFAIRVSERYRSSAREYITTFGPPNRGGDVSPGSGFSTALPEHVVDGQISYSLQKGPAKGLTFYFQAYNLTDEPLITLNNGDPRQVMNYQKYGASYSLGASFKF